MKTIHGSVAFLILCAQVLCAEERAVTSDSYSHLYPRWSPDGMYITYQKYDSSGHWQIYKVEQVGGVQTALTVDLKDHTRPVWSSASGQVGYEKVDATGVKQIYRIPAIGGSEVPLSALVRAHTSPRFSPDDQWVAYEMKDDSNKTQIWKVSAAGGESPTEIPLTSTSYDHASPEWSPGGSKLACSVIDGTGYGQIHVFSESGGTETSLTNSSAAHQYPQWSPDGTQMVYQRQESGQYVQIYKVSSTGGSEVALTSDLAHHQMPQWSGDGEWIVYHKTDLTGKKQIYKMPSEGGEESPLTTDDYTHQDPQECPAGDGRIVYAKLDESGKYQIYVLDPSTGSPTPTASPTATPTPSSTASTPTRTPTPIAATATPTPSDGTATPTAVPNWTDVGWVRADGSASLAGLLLYGDRLNTGMAGLPASATLAKHHWLCHYASSNRWYTGIGVANPDPSQTAQVNVVAYNTMGKTSGTASFSIPPKGKWSKLVSDPTVFGSLTGTGWMDLTSDVDVVAFELYGDKIDGGLAALTGSVPSASFVIPHFHCSSRWWTGISVINPNGSSVEVMLTAYSNQGAILDAYSNVIQKKGSLVGFVDDFMDGAANQTGWIRVEATGGFVSGLVVFGDRAAVPNQIAALSPVAPAQKVILADFRNDTEWWTGLAVVNPDETQNAVVTLNAYAQSGELLDSLAINVTKRCKLLGMVGSLFDLGSAASGWIEAESSQSIVGLELIQSDDDSETAWGLGGIASQSSGADVFYGHYAVDSRWWTLLALTNPGSTATGAVLTAYGSDGGFVAQKIHTVPAKGGLADQVKTLLGVP